MQNKNNVYRYEDSGLIVDNKKFFKNKNFIDIMPLDFSINNLINKINTKTYIKDSFSLEITKILKKIDNKLLKLK